MNDRSRSREQWFRNPKVGFFGISSSSSLDGLDYSNKSACERAQV